MSASKIFRLSLTMLLLAAALWVGRTAWDHYMESAWTRDGRIKADVVTISADVAGTVTDVMVRDNQMVKQGDVLFVVDKARYQNALAQANAMLASQQVEKGRRSKEASRRAALDSSIISAESMETAQLAVGTASAQYQAALAALCAGLPPLYRDIIKVNPQPVADAALVAALLPQK